MTDNPDYEAPWEAVITHAKEGEPKRRAMTRIEEIKSRLDAATDGPWETADLSPSSVRKGKHTVACMAGSPQAKRTDVEAEILANATFIANAPSDIAYLIEQNKRLRGLVNDIIENALALPEEQTPAGEVK